METHSANTLGNEYQQFRYSTVYKGFILFNTYQQLSTTFNSSLSSVMLLTYQTVNLPSVFVQATLTV